ncbi:MAG: hypothetical protein L0Y43_02020 [Methylococcaceae bacterium]|nr:hypothetical protein [Methylococcaceae bacterium]
MLGDTYLNAHYSIGGKKYFMVTTNRQSGTNVHEVADGIYRINTPVVIEGAGGFSFNQYLITDDQPLLFHTGPRKMFPIVREKVVLRKTLNRDKVTEFFAKLPACLTPDCAIGGGQ